MPPPQKKMFDFNLEMARFDAHLNYSDVLILKFCIAT